MAVVSAMVGSPGGGVRDEDVDLGGGVKDEDVDERNFIHTWGEKPYSTLRLHCRQKPDNL